MVSQVETFGTNETPEFTRSKSLLWQVQLDLVGITVKEMVVEFAEALVS